MNSFSEERAFKQIADAYVDRYGEDLLNEIDEHTGSDTPRLDKLMNTKLKREKRRNILPRIAATAAACIVLLILLPSMLRRGVTQTPPASDSAPAAPIVPLEPNVTAELPGPIPVTFTLSDKYSIMDMEQDKGQTVYYIGDEMGDDIVLTLEYLNEAPDYAGMEMFTINGQIVRGMYAPDYSLLMFEREGILYTLTCRHDINTLIDLGENILI